MTRSAQESYSASSLPTRLPKALVPNSLSHSEKALLGMAVADLAQASQNGVVQFCTLRAGSLSSPGSSAMQNFMLRRAVGAAAAFEKHLKDQRPVSTTSLSSSLKVGIASLSPTASPSNLTPNVLSSCGGSSRAALGPTDARPAFVGKAVPNASHHAMPFAPETSSAWSLQVLAQGRRTSIPDYNAVGNGAAKVETAGDEGGANNGVASGAKEGVPVRTTAVKSRRFKATSVEQNGHSTALTSGPLDPLPDGGASGQQARGQGFSTQAVAIQEEDPYNGATSAPNGNATRYDKDAQERRARAQAKQAQSSFAKPPPPPPKSLKSATPKRTVYTKPSKGASGVNGAPPRLVGGAIPADNLAPAVAAPSEINSRLTVSSNGRAREVSDSFAEEIGSSSDRFNSDLRPVNQVGSSDLLPGTDSVDVQEPPTTNGAASFSEPVTGVLAGGPADSSEPNGRTLPPLAAVTGKASKPRGRPPKAIQAPMMETPPAPVETPLETPTPLPAPSSGVPKAVPLPVFSNTVQPVSRRVVNGAVGKQPDTVRGAPMRDLLEENGIILPDYAIGEHRILCPMVRLYEVI